MLQRLLLSLPPELAHALTLRLLPLYAYVRTYILPYWPIEPHMAQDFLGYELKHPFGVAAGFDKNARVVRAIAQMGYSFLEIGTVTPKPQLGNPKPRLFRLKLDKALINRLGFPSDGAKKVAVRLAQLPKHYPLPLLVNIGCNKDSLDKKSDFVRAAEILGNYATALVLNVSSPNTKDLRNWQQPKALQTLIQSVRQVTDKPLILKLSPDMASQQIQELADLALNTKMSAVILTNSTTSRPFLKSSARDEMGGLSGAPLMALATQRLAQFYLASGGKIPLIGVGGVMTAHDAITKIRAGASLVQTYTGYVYHGHQLLRQEIQQLALLLKSQTLKQLVGCDAKKFMR